MTTVGASTIDRAFPADLVLEDGTVLTGTSLFKGKALSNTTYIPLFYGFKKKNYCEPGSLKKSQVSGKIVVCDVGFGVFQGVVVKEAGGVGVVSLNTPEEENPWDLNYPAISVAFADASKSEVLVTRTVTHVSDVASATYKVSITSPKDVTVTVDPETLVFKEKGEKLSYKVEIQADKKMLLENKSKKNDFDLGRLVWTDGKHQVTSLIVMV
ncbi:hypothetical protein LWI28_002011 [Acer negundo]|uniref:Subtilisin-like protease fibronectin type-III domain-containing protein n=1 Tax=Acer negundo TaxID=4023 RepID=A0AAD5I876_ACENE|nr:hypothetical protein LWI28_002011 [Acer negundo]